MARAARERHDRFVQAFMSAVTQGDLHELKSLLHNDVVLRTDGGGKVKAALQPLFGPDSVARFVLGVKKKVEDAAVAAGRAREDAYTLSAGTVNGAPAVFVWHSGVLDAAIGVSASADGIFELDLVRNPDKLTWLLRELNS